VIRNKIVSVQEAVTIVRGGDTLAQRGGGYSMHDKGEKR
jgi:hypothetical protein